MSTLAFEHDIAARRWSTGVHSAALILAFLTSWAAGAAGMVGAAAVILMKPANGSAFVEAHAKEAFNFNFSMFLYAVLAVIVMVLTLGIGVLLVAPLGLVLAIVWVVCTIRAAMAANDGKPYRYPLSMRVWR